RGPHLRAVARDGAGRLVARPREVRARDRDEPPLLPLPERDPRRLRGLALEHEPVLERAAEQALELADVVPVDLGEPAALRRPQPRSLEPAGEHALRAPAHGPREERRDATARGHERANTRVP